MGGGFSLQLYPSVSPRIVTMYTFQHRTKTLGNNMRSICRRRLWGARPLCYPGLGAA